MGTRLPVACPPSSRSWRHSRACESRSDLFALLQPLRPVRQPSRRRLPNLSSRMIPLTSPPNTLQEHPVQLDLR